MPLRFGEDSYFPHLAAARRCGIEPTVIRQPGIAMDIDHPVDLAAFLRLPQSAGTRTLAFLERIGVLDASTRVSEAFSLWRREREAAPPRQARRACAAA